jgi:hypothetical protein
MSLAYKILFVKQFQIGMVERMSSDQNLVEDVETVVTWTLERYGDNYDKESEVRKLSSELCVVPGSCD